MGDPPVDQMLFEGAQDAVEAFKVLRPALANDQIALDVVDAHIAILEYAISKARRYYS